MSYFNLKDRHCLSEAYNTILEKKKKSEDEKSEDEKDVNKDGKVDKTDSYLANRRKAISLAIAKKTKTNENKKNFEETLKETYMTLFENKFLNKKFIRRYNKITASLLKAEPGSKIYTQLKNERDDLVNILKDHGMTVKDLEALLNKENSSSVEEKEKSFSPNVNHQYPNSDDSDVKEFEFVSDKPE